MANKFDSKSVNYLRPDLEFDQLDNTNVGILVAEPPFTLGGGFPNRARTTGNGLIFIDAHITLTAAGVSVDDVLVTFPLEYGPSHEMVFIIGRNDQSATRVPFPVDIRSDAALGISEIRAKASAPQGDTLFLEGISYFRES